MRKLALLSVWLALPLGIVGCSHYHPTVSVYDRSGAVFTAPSLCAALVACMNSKETSCFYERDVISTNAVQPEMAMEECHELKK